VKPAASPQMPPPSTTVWLRETSWKWCGCGSG
jgi:hypothetical protein